MSKGIPSATTLRYHAPLPRSATTLRSQGPPASSATTLDEHLCGSCSTPTTAEHGVKNVQTENAHNGSGAIYIYIYYMLYVCIWELLINIYIYPIASSVCNYVQHSQMLKIFPSVGSGDLRSSSEPTFIYDFLGFISYMTFGPLRLCNTNEMC